MIKFSKNNVMAIQTKLIYIYARSRSSRTYNKETNHMLTALIQLYRSHVAREYITCTSASGHYLQLTVYRNIDESTASIGTKPCLLVIHNRTMFFPEEIAIRYASCGLVVVSYIIDKHDQLVDLFDEPVISDLGSVYEHVNAFISKLNYHRIFALGNAYTAGVILRFVSRYPQFFAGVVLTNPLIRLGHLVTNATSTKPVLVGSHTSHLLGTTGIETSEDHNLYMRAERLQIIDERDRQRFQFEGIDVPMYIVTDLSEPCTDMYATLSMFSILKQHPRTCLRYVVNGDVDYDDIFTWCGSMLHAHNGSIQTYDVLVETILNTVSSHVSARPSQSLEHMYTVELASVNRLTYCKPIWQSIHVYLKYLIVTYSIMRPLISVQHTVIWTKVFKTATNIIGFPRLSLSVNHYTAPFIVEFCLVSSRSQRRFSWARIYLDSVTTEPVSLILSMMSVRFRADDELLLIMSSDPDSMVSYAHTTITCGNLLLPYIPLMPEHIT